MDVVAQFAELFEGRKDAFGLEHGECWRPRPQDANKHQWLWRVEEHLNGNKPIGVYPVTDPHAGHGNFCKWGCVDLDQGKPSAAYSTYDDARTASLNLQRALDALNITSWVERSKSGAHVWVFAREWVPAATMRRALLVACDVAEVPPREVNPKSETLAEGSPGNYVRLPYPNGLHGTIGVRTVYTHTDPNWMLSVRSFVDQAHRQRNATNVLAEAALLYRVPETPEFRPQRNGPVPDATKLTTPLNGYAYTLFTGGPLEGSDRSGYLFKLAVACRDSGVDHNWACEVVRLADESHCQKYTDRSDAERRYADLVSSAYTGS